MHPAASLVLFTTAAGAGYGLLFLLGLALPLGLLPAERWFGVVALGWALGLISLGLAASTFHLGHPERAWRALSQWRTSWLSREGVAAVFTYGAATPFGIGWVFFESAGGLWAICALLATAGAAATIGCTAMIYASLKPIRHWHSPWVPPVFAAFALMTGGLWLSALARLFGNGAPWTEALAAATLLLAWGLKAGYWRTMARQVAVATPESATSLGHLGRVRQLDPPHTEENYLQREMGFRIARKHGRRLRHLALLFGLVLPLALLGAAYAAAPGTIGALSVVLAAGSGSLGVIIERWLFFAEAKHTVMLYYGHRDTDETSPAL